MVDFQDDLIIIHPLWVVEVCSATLYESDKTKTPEVDGGQVIEG